MSSEPPTTNTDIEEIPRAPIINRRQNNICFTVTLRPPTPAIHRSPTEMGTRTAFFYGKPPLPSTPAHH